MPPQVATGRRGYTRAQVPFAVSSSGSGRNGVAAAQGTTKHTGQDGVWRFPSERPILIEVKTTDAYSINLNTIAGYRKALITNGELAEETSSMLFVAGRQETDNLEAQIRGSKFAWNIRVISVGALLRLMLIKEELEDPVILHRIHAVLVPHEFTRLDAIAELLFSAAKEIKQEETESETESVATEKTGKAISRKFTPVAFHEECIARLQKTLGVSLVKRTRSGYSSPYNDTAVICSVSKEHNPESAPNYWFAFHPHQQTFLAPFKNTFVSFGCGSSKQLLLVPYDKFKPWLANAGTTTNEGRMYWHIVISRRKEAYSMRLRKGTKPVDLTPFALPLKAELALG